MKSNEQLERNATGAEQEEIRSEIFGGKKLTVLHKHIASVFETLINEERDIDLQWLVMVETDMIPKEGEWSAVNHRPITLLNTCYKWLTGILKDKMESHMEKFNMLQCDQRGGRKGTWGVVDNLMIDAMVLEECRMRRKNLSCTWVDVAKVYDSVSHKWLLKALELHKIPLAITNTIRKLSTQWKTKLRVRTQSGVGLTDPIQFKRGICQGDTLYPLLFIMCVNPMSWKL